MKGSYSVREFRDVMEVNYNGSSVKNYSKCKAELENGNLDSMVNISKYGASGRHWSTEAIKLFRSFWTERDENPSIYRDNEGRKLNYKDFNGKWQYGPLYGVVPQSITLFLLVLFETSSLFLSSRGFGSSFSRHARIR